MLAKRIYTFNTEITSLPRRNYGELFFYFKSGPDASQKGVSHEIFPVKQEYTKSVHTTCRFGNIF